MTDLPHDSDPTGSIAEAQHRAVHAAILSTLRAVAPRHAIEAAHDLLTRTSWTMWSEAGLLVVEWNDRLRTFAYWVDRTDARYVFAILDHHALINPIDAVQNTASHLTGWLHNSLPGVSASPTLTPGTDSIDLDVIDLRGL